MKNQKYWKYEIEPDYSKNEDQWSKILYELINESVKKRLVADVPVGVFLSGGLDSSIISLLAKKNLKGELNTFSINFSENSFDESNYSNYLSSKIGSNHHHQTIDFNNMEGICNELFTKIDEPLSDSSLISYYLLTKFAQKKVKVALGGDAADELFAGYDTFKAIRYANIMKVLRINKNNSLLKFFVSKIPSNYTNMNFKFKIDRFLRFDKNKFELSHCHWLSPMTSAEISDFFGEKTSDDELFSEAVDLWNKNNYTNTIRR